MTPLPNKGEMSIMDLAGFILQNTHDGDDLAPRDLKLVEIAANGWLSEEGEVAFYELVANVEQGYKPPYFHGVEHMTRDHEGYVYWKGIRVEHYSGSLVYTDEGREHLLELAERCKHLEAIGVEVNARNAVWTWEFFELRISRRNSGMEFSGAYYQTAEDFYELERLFLRATKRSVSQHDGETWRDQKYSSLHYQHAILARRIADRLATRGTVLE